MHDPGSGRVEWVQPRRRTLIPIEPEKFHASRSLRKVVASGRFRVTADRAFGAVIRACAEAAPGRLETWIDPTIIDLFELLHDAGIAHSIEVWLPGDSVDDVLVGGIYGISVGRIFAGESMFSRPALGGTNASKVALTHLVHHIRARGYATLDAQLMNPHLVQFGAFEVPHREFITLVGSATDQQAAWGTFDPELAPRAQFGAS